MFLTIPFVLGALLLLGTLPLPATGMAAPRKPRTGAPGDPAPIRETILLMGQSNMVGRDRPVKDPADVRVKAYLSNKWRTAAEPLHKVGYGPGVAFGQRLVRDGYARTVRLVPCAVGGTAMKRWTPPGDLFRACVAKMRRTGQVATGALFYQGESDAGTLADANNWAPRLGKMVDGLRGATKNPRLPVVFAQLGSTTRPAPYWAQVKASQASVSISNVTMIRTEDLPVFDGLHLTVGAQRVVGCRFAQEFARLRGFTITGGPC